MRKKIIFSLLVSIITSISFSWSVNAKTDAYLTQDKNGSYYLYDYNSLITSSLRDFLNLSAPLYRDFRSRKLVAFHDDIKGYVNSNDVIRASLMAFIKNQQFKLNDFTQNALPENLLSVQSSVQEVIEKDGKLEMGMILPKAIVEKLEVLSSTGSTKIEVSVSNEVNIEDIVVKVNGVKLDYDSLKNRFIGTINKIYNSKDDAQRDISVEKNNEIFDVSDIY